MAGDGDVVRRVRPRARRRHDRASGVVGDHDRLGRAAAQCEEPALRSAPLQQRRRLALRDRMGGARAVPVRQPARRLPGAERDCAHRLRRIARPKSRGHLGRVYKPLDTAVPQQFFATSMVLTPLVRGLLGVEVDAPAGTCATLRRACRRSGIRCWWSTCGWGGTWCRLRSRDARGRFHSKHGGKGVMCRGRSM